jgi:hypothetical protein
VGRRFASGRSIRVQENEYAQDRLGPPRGLYSRPTINAGMDGALMNRLVLFAVLLFQSSLIFCQSTATPTGSPHVPGKVSMGQWPFGFGNGQPGQTAARPVFKSFDRHRPNASQNQANVPMDLDHLFNASCTDLKSHVELFALNENSLSRPPLVVEPHPKGEPIPTQWPNAKIEQIPTQWPNLKLQPIGGESPGLVPVHRSAR